MSRARLPARVAVAITAAAAVMAPVATYAELGVGTTSSSAAAQVSVDVRDNTFSPGTVTIGVGDTVRWEQSGEASHTVTADDGSFDSHPNCPPVCMGEGDSFEQTFEDAGTFRYYCRLHGGEGGTGMAGRVVVKAASSGGSSGETSGGADIADGNGTSGGGRTGSRSLAGTGSAALVRVAAALLLIAWGALARTTARSARSR